MATFPTQLKFPRQMQESLLGRTSASPSFARDKGTGFLSCGEFGAVPSLRCPRGGWAPMPVETQLGGAQRPGNALLCSFPPGSAPAHPSLPSALPPFTFSPRPLPASVRGLFNRTKKVPPHPCCSSPGEVFGDKPCQEPPAAQKSPLQVTLEHRFQLGPGLVPQHGPARGERCSPEQAWPSGALVFTISGGSAPLGAAFAVSQRLWGPSVGLLSRLFHFPGAITLRLLLPQSGFFLCFFLFFCLLREEKKKIS